MPRKPKDYEFLSVKLDRTISERFTKFCNDTARTKTAALEMIRKQYLDKYDKENSENE